MHLFSLRPQILAPLYPTYINKAQHCIQEKKRYIHTYIYIYISVQFSSVAQSCPTLCDPMDRHSRPPCPLPTPGVHPNPCPSSWWCHPTISSSVIPFSSCPQSLPASGSFPMNQLFSWGGQSIRVSASASVLPMNTQDWSPLGWTSWISLQFKGHPSIIMSYNKKLHYFLNFCSYTWNNKTTFLTLYILTVVDMGETSQVNSFRLKVGSLQVDKLWEFGQTPGESEEQGGLALCSPWGHQELDTT